MHSELATTPRFQRPLAGLLLLLVLGVSLYLFTRHNTFAFYIHPDERGKVSQILDKSRNFHHPLLMLSVAAQITKWRADWLDRKPGIQETVVTGRWVAAAFMAGAVTLFTLLLLRTVGWPGAISLAAILCLDPTLFHVAHFMKEDPPFLCMMAGLFVVFTIYDRQPTGRHLSFLGAATGLVASAKYPGLICLAVILPILIARHRQQSLAKALILFLGTMTGVFLLINFRMIVEWQKFTSGFGREVTEVVIGQHGMRQTSVPHARYLQMLGQAFPVWYWLAIVAYGILIFKKHRDRWREHAFPYLVAIALLVMISFSPKISDRYVLPVEILILVAFCGGVGLLFQGIPRVPRLAAALIATGFLGGALCTQWAGHLPGRVGYQEMVQSYTVDSFEILNDWIETHLPQDAILLQPEKRFLPDPELGFFKDWPRRLPQKIYSQSSFIKSGSLASAREAGVTHVVVIGGRLSKYDTGLLFVTDTSKMDRSRRAAFYNELEVGSRRVFSLPPQRNFILHPGFEIYELTPQQG